MKITLGYPNSQGFAVSEAIDKLSAFGKALSAPTKHDEGGEIRSFNVVEMAAACEEGESAWDTPCRYGDHVIGHAVYCQSPWPDRPRKCRREWSGEENRVEDCPSFAPNKNYKPE